MPIGFSFILIRSGILSQPGISKYDISKQLVSFIYKKAPFSDEQGFLKGIIPE